MKKLIYVSLIILAGCSTMSRKWQQDTLIDADRYMVSAQKAEMRQEYSRALDLYHKAYINYTLVDDLEGKIHSGLSAARQDFYLDSEDEFNYWMETADALINVENRELSVPRDLLLVEINVYQSNYPEALKIAEAIETSNREWELERDCYLALVKLKLGLDYQADYLKIEKTLPVIARAFRKNKLHDQVIYSFACYTLGYILSQEQKWDEALRYFQEAQQADRLLENPAGLADNLFAQANCFIHLQDQEKALSCLQRAAEIYSLLKNPEMYRKSMELSEQLQQQKKDS